MSLLEPIQIVYNGGWADEHTLPLREFAKSADGLDDILSLCAEFAITQQVILNRSARSVRLVTKAPAAGSFEFIPIIEAALQHPLIVSASSGLFGALTGLVCAKLARRPEEAVLKATVEKLLEELGREKERNNQMVERFISSLEKKRPAAARCVSPIGAGCDEIVLGPSTKHELILYPKDRELIELGPDAELAASKVTLLISELDRVTGGCRVSFLGEKKRYWGAILDSTVRIDGNSYASALTAGKPIDVLAEISLVEGEIKKIMILGIAKN
jgi:hypothetical protein